ncbi:hypothetical protein AU710_00025 [Salmonella enterica subsp. enterica serovar Corvallis]|nr:hypothetical protein [Salmonella enterica subsp. enterica serovar Corvallis]ECY4202813.1 hypothetical protein [Salmonella enterica subsp. enterica serovar Corvallis]
MMECRTLGFMKYQPSPEDLCSLCGGNFGKAAMIEGKDKIHICMECVDLLGVIKKERYDKKRGEAVHAIAELCRNSASNSHSAELIYDAIKCGKIVID